MTKPTSEFFVPEDIPQLPDTSYVAMEARVAELETELTDVGVLLNMAKDDNARLRVALERIAKIRTLPLTDLNDTDEELAAQYSSVIDTLVHISREALSGTKEIK